MAKAKIFVRELSSSEKSKLNSIVRKRTIDYSLKQRSEIILLSSQGCEVKLIEHRTGLDQSNVIKWIKRFNQGGIEALGDIQKPGRPNSSAFRSRYSEEVKPFALEWIDNDGIKGGFARGYVDNLAYSDLESARAIVTKHSEWSSKRKAKFLLCMPLNDITLGLVDNLQGDGRKEFWSNLNHYIISKCEPKIVTHIAINLLENDRPLAAVDALAQIFYSGHNTKELDTSVIVAILKFS